MNSHREEDTKIEEDGRDTPAEKEASANTARSTNTKQKRLRRSRRERVYSDHRRSRILWTIITEITKENFGRILVLVASTILGVLGVLFTPLNDVFIHTLWNEDVQIQLKLSSVSVFEGEPLYLQAQLIPKSPIEVSPGILSIESDAASLRLVSPQSPDFATPSFKNPTLIPQSEMIQMEAGSPGEARVAAVLRTKYGEYRAEETIQIPKVALNVGEQQSLASRTTPDTNVDIPLIEVSRKKPSLGNLGGTWNITLGNARGTMVILETERYTLVGTYHLNSTDNRSEQEDGSISGYRDGTTFHVFFMRPTRASEWKVVGLFQKTNDSLEIKGTAVLQVIGEGDWQSRGQEYDFYAAAALYR